MDGLGKIEAQPMKSGWSEVFGLVRAESEALGH